MSEPQYTLTLTAAQAQTLIQATDMYMRVLCGQFHVVAEQFVARKGISYKALDVARQHLDAAKALIFPELGSHSGASHSISSPKTPETSKIAYDLHQAIRHRTTWDRDAVAGYTEAHRKGFRGVWHSVPTHTSQEPLATIQGDDKCPCSNQFCQEA